MSTPRPVLIAALAAAAIVVSACNSAPSPVDESSLPQLTEAAVAESPPADYTDGRVFRPGGVLADSELTDLAVAAGDVLAVRSGGHLGIGTPEQFEAGDNAVVDIAAGCGPLSARETTFVLACPDEEDGGIIRLFDADFPGSSETIRVSAPVTAAAVTDDGRILAGASGDGDVLVISPGGSGESDTDARIAIKDSVDQLITVPVSGESDRAVVIDRGNTVISGVDWTNSKPGAALRAGLGVGRLTVGEPGTGVVFASDTRGGQLLVYTVSPVIMLHQMATAGASPWALTWDSGNQVVWVSDTADNLITAYSVAEGVPVAVGSLHSAADIRGLGITRSGDLIAVGSDGIQIVDATTRGSALEDTITS
ncbi:WD40 repeat domain-containing protein [Corynebacterium sp. CCM 9185]|uniref:WD40 repeat domain-containing protein n=1 Tax=Corynebacterium marambiense TaxID=2765364 RepID=A0ABS0VYR8_9CORY|nr:WD40 repeat domain-containing protein [Corynebacterium marambiense]MBI9000462.1 WD40 repeat domain-containing protein [Corynebacterium marambiense]MCK7664216.1 WD40 repeat domain-containing protein [Corynebacterium marambiense]